MIKHAAELFRELLEEAIDCETLPMFLEYKNMTTNHAERMIIGLLDERKLYRYQDRIFIRWGEKLCYISQRKPSLLHNVGTGNGPTWYDNITQPIQIILPFSPKWICGGRFKSGQLKAIDNYFDFHQVIHSLID